MRPRIRPALFLSRAFITLFGFAAVATPWRTVYIDPAFWGCDWLIRHEVAHLAQMQRDGWFTFWRQCLVWYFVPGYDGSPYEIEAREAERNPHHPLLRGWEIEDDKQHAR